MKEKEWISDLGILDKSATKQDIVDKYISEHIIKERHPLQF